MELLDGRTPKQRIADNTVDAEQLLEWGIQIAAAMTAAHSAGIVHRDIKPASIFITERGQAKILDLGLAKVAARRHAAEPAGSQMVTADSGELYLTRPGVTVGTAAYMSPEQVLPEELDARTDLFSFGVVLYEMATGTLPFQGATSAALANEILNKTPKSLLFLNPDLQPRLDKDLVPIGREYNGRYVLEGRVRKAGQSARITAQLGDVWGDRPIWVDKYTGELDRQASHE
jgi:serine/threonine protein kinase